VISIESIGVPGGGFAQAAEKSAAFINHSVRRRLGLWPPARAVSIASANPARTVPAVLMLAGERDALCDRARARKPSFGNDAGKLHERR